MRSRLCVLAFFASLASAVLTPSAALSAEPAPAHGAPPEWAGFPSDCWGVYGWADWDPRTVTRERCPLIKGVAIILLWREVEPTEGDYRFEEQLGERLKEARKNGFYVFTMIWTGQHSPEWLYKIGVPKVQCSTTTSAITGKSRDMVSPYFFDKTYTDRYYRLIRAFGAYVRDLPDDLLRRIVFVNCCEGSTGDPFCYKGQPLDARYAITREAWSEYRTRAWQVFKEAFMEGDRPPVALLMGADYESPIEHEWLLKNLPVIGRKMGVFSHGYHFNEEQDRLDDWRAFVARAEAMSKPVFNRGEMDRGWEYYGWQRKNPMQSLYWTAIHATYCGMDFFELPYDACQGDTYADAIRFFSRYVRQRDPAKAPAAFCALHRGLDSADTEVFPEAKFGKAEMANVERYVKIAAEFAAYGAREGDPQRATGGTINNRQRKDYNDAGWRIFTGNYWRFLEQIAPDATSAAYWHIGPPEHVFSAFARGFDSAHGKTAMLFRLDDRFFEDPARPRAVKARIAWLDRGHGSWALTYAAAKGNGATKGDGAATGKRTALRVTCADSRQWREQTVAIEDVCFNHRLPEGADLALEWLSGDDTLFHIVELYR